jgi:hypothetical protein
MDAARDPVDVCAVLRPSANQTGHQRVTTPAFKVYLADGTMRPSARPMSFRTMQSIVQNRWWLPTQNPPDMTSIGYQQQGLAAFGRCLRIIAGTFSKSACTNFLAHAGTYAAGHDRSLCWVWVT